MGGVGHRLFVMIKENIYNTTDFDSIFEYNEAYPSCLVWKIDIYAGMFKSTKNASSGTPAGYRNTLGYFEVGYHYNKYLCSRVVWVMHRGSIDQNLVVDHIDGDKSNNKISNLRLVSVKINSRNCSKPKNNTSGFQGVNLHDNGYGDKYWRARYKCSLTGKEKSKYFNIAELGYETAFNLAVSWRKNMLQEQNMLGAGYSERHINSKTTVPC